MKSIGFTKGYQGVLGTQETKKQHLFPCLLSFYRKSVTVFLGKDRNLRNVQFVVQWDIMQNQTEEIRN